jgi:SAM-dependent methyltransferase
VPDPAIEAIRTAAERQLTFQWLRSRFRADHGLKGSLDYGHAVLDSPQQLDQYLHTHGLMIESQWRNMARFLEGVRAPALWIDYGCGQGLAGLLASELTGGQLLRRVRDIVLIEPSPVALARAAALYRRLAPEAALREIGKRFDAVNARDLPAATDGSTLHVFSNSLDLEGFDPVGLLTKTLRPGHHTIISVSHDRPFRGGTPQIEKVKAAIEAPPMAGRWTVCRSDTHEFTCDNPGQFDGFGWFCDLEVEDG